MVVSPDYVQQILQLMNLLPQPQLFLNQPILTPGTSSDLGNLLDLLDDNTFKESAIDSFFAGDMAMFLKVQGTPSQKKTKGRRKQYIRHNVHSILDLVGESITSFVSGTAERNKTSVALEALAGNISSISLPRWAGRLSKLKSMKLWDGAALDGNLAATIAKNCL